LERTQAFVNGLAEQSDRFGLKVELIIVEWNPPPDRERMALALRWPARTSNLRVRIIEVPHSIHELFRHSEALPMFQMIAKNVGIRAASGRFVLATNPDILFSNEIVRYWASERLQTGKYYRAERHDVPPDASVQGLVDSMLAYSSSNVRRAWKRYVSIDYASGRIQPTYPDSKGLRGLHALLWAAGLLVIFNFLRARWGTAFVRLRQESRNRKRVANARRSFSDAWRAFRRDHLGLGRRYPRVSVLHWADVVLSKLERIGYWLGARRGRRTVPRPHRSRIERILNDALVMPPPSQPKLFTVACGDFTLMSKQDWERVRGYPEMPIFSLHIDSLLLYQAHYSGIVEVCLKGPIYHMEHSRGWAVVMESVSPYEDLRQKGVPILAMSDFYRIVDPMVKSGRPVLFNSENWGLKKQILGETRPQGAISEGPLVMTYK
jgi:hypothetical protein